MKSYKFSVSEDFPHGSVVKTLLPLQEVQIQTLVRELRSCVACSLSPPKIVAVSEHVESLNPISDNLNYHI